MEDNTEDILVVARNDYRQGKELFGINVYGSSLHDILLTVLIVPCLCAIYHEICELMFKSRLYSLISRRVLVVIHYLLEVGLFILPIIGVCTIYHDRLILYITLFALWSILHVINLIVKHSDETKKNSATVLTEGTVESSRKGYITAFRSVVVLYTCLAILAVDFPIFPRKYAKTYLYGFSLMDIGVGLYIVTSGLVGGVKHSSLSSFFQRVISLFIIGVCRFFFVKLSGYVVNNLEYGPHWNFFYTLVIVLTGGYVLLYFIHKRRILLVTAVICLVYYQIFLSMGLYEHIRDNKGTSWFDLNAAGVFSTIGFLSIYLFSAFLGRQLNDQQNKSVCKKLYMEMIACGCLFYLLEQYVQPANRRMCNPAFVLLVLFVTLVIVCAAYTVNSVYKSVHVPMILRAINEHQLAVFLMANVLTGAVNMSVQTMFISTQHSLLILIGYMVILSLFACIRASRYSFKVSKE